MRSGPTAVGPAQSGVPCVPCVSILRCGRRHIGAISETGTCGRLCAPHPTQSSQVRSRVRIPPMVFCARSLLQQDEDAGLVRAAQIRPGLVLEARPPARR